MTHKNNDLLSQAAAVLLNEGWESIPEMIRIVVKQAMAEEREQVIKEIRW